MTKFVISGIIKLLQTPILHGKEVNTTLELFLSFLVSVTANFVTYMICKWLDGNRK